MSMGSMEFDDLYKFFQGIERLADNKDELLLRCANALAGDLVAFTKKRTPVDTGHLRQEWKAEPAKMQGDEAVSIVFNPVEYAAYVEYGHRVCRPKGVQVGYSPGRFMLTMSMKEIRRKQGAILQKELLKWLKEAANGG